MIIYANLLLYMYIVVIVVAQFHLVLYLIIFIRNWVNCCDIIIKYNVDEITLELRNVASCQFAPIGPISLDNSKKE